MLLAQIDTEKKQALAKAEELFARADEEKRTLTDEEREQVQAHLTKADELDAKLKTGKEDTSLRDRMAAFRAAKSDDKTMTERVVGRKIAARTLGQLVMASAIGEAIKAGAFRGRFNSSSVEFLAETLTETASPAGGGALIIPDYRPGIWPILTQQPRVRSLIASGTTDSNLVVYFKETLATNAAEGVEETAAKPESSLRFAKVEESVKKIATWIPVSTEMLDDFAQTSSIIDARLRQFLLDEEDDELLNGDGLDGDLLGIRNRSDLTALYTQTTDSAIDAIHHQITEIMVASFVLPTGIVMHPRDWHRIVTAKSSTAGEYFGNNPFAPAQPLTLWGLPVTPTTRMTEGRVLLGAFSTMSQVFDKGGVSVDMSNSHDDFFIKNKVAVRAEKREALAVYRPAAFGEVAIDTGESES